MFSETGRKRGMSHPVVSEHPESGDAVMPSDDVHEDGDLVDYRPGPSHRAVAVWACHGGGADFTSDSTTRVVEVVGVDPSMLPSLSEG
ncbi:hypothetical protein FMUND_12201 [Fusarium mundagurra]|uniref:Uncharacterized protein n=1 Tax=Fusarium mundagurra TaxID=1567541 RepID=A0A8H6D5Y4_9HYPO|nr:hypothetical protein FMUND_12201 [Fusarium mundagurra]